MCPQNVSLNNKTTVDGCDLWSMQSRTVRCSTEPVLQLRITRLRCLCQLTVACSLVAIWSVWTHSSVALYPLHFTLLSIFSLVGFLPQILFDRPVLSPAGEVSLSSRVIDGAELEIYNIYSLYLKLSQPWGTARWYRQNSNWKVTFLFADVGYSAKGEGNQMHQIMQCSLPNLLVGKMRDSGLKGGS